MPNIWNEVRPIFFDPVASKFWKGFQICQQRLASAATAEPRAPLVTYSNNRLSSARGRPKKARCSPVSTFKQIVHTHTRGGAVTFFWNKPAPGHNFDTRGTDATRQPLLHSSRLSLSTYHRARSREVFRSRDGAVATQLENARVLDAVCILVSSNKKPAKLCRRPSPESSV